MDEVLEDAETALCYTRMTPNLHANDLHGDASEVVAAFGEVYTKAQLFADVRPLASEEPVRVGWTEGPRLPGYTVSQARPSFRTPLQAEAFYFVNLANVTCCIAKTYNFSSLSFSIDEIVDGR